jgi:hypothetical protein
MEGTSAGRLDSPRHIPTLAAHISLHETRYQAPTECWVRLVHGFALHTARGWFLARFHDRAVADLDAALIIVHSAERPQRSRSRVHPLAGWCANIRESLAMLLQPDMPPTPGRARQSAKRILPPRHRLTDSGAGVAAREDSVQR